MIEKAARFVKSEPIVWGPIFLFCTISLTVQSQIPFDLVFLAAAGFFLSVRLQMRGCVYALILLSVTALFKHFVLPVDHFFLIGIEASFALAFFITALAAEQGANWISSLSSQAEMRKVAIENLEDEIFKVKEESQEQQICFQEKVALIQKELEELQSEHSSILILNEVLRKKTASIVQNLQQAELFKAECQTLQSELARIKNSDELALQNQELFRDLNHARTEREQVELINETLTRLTLREKLKAKEAEIEAGSLKEQLRSVHEHARKIAAPFEEKLIQNKKVIEDLRFEIERLSKESSKLFDESEKVKQLLTERNFLKERLSAATSEIEHLQLRKGEQVDPKLMEKLIFAEEKVGELAKIEPLYRQLKKQFEEKNQILHQVRSDLFKTDTELQKIKIEQAALALNPLPKEVEEEMELLANQVGALEEENRELQDLVSLLNNSQSEQARPKKKLKMKSASPEQDLLF